MLHELRVENLLLIERAELRLTAGLNVLTGETGAGKTVLAHALDLLLGGKARPGIVRPGAAEAYVEGVFDLPAGLRARLGDRVAEDAEDLVLARRVSAEGRTRALIGGRSASAGDLRDIATTLLAFYGQHEHRRLTLASAQLAILDEFCGPRQAEQRARAARAHTTARAAQTALEDLRERAGTRERELDLARFELAEIEEVGPDAAEELALLGRRDRLRHLVGLRAAGFAAAEALSPEDGTGAATMLAAGATALEGVRGIDADLDALAERWRSAEIEVQDLSAELRRYADGLEGDPGTLDHAEARLAELDRLKRKHGGSLDAVLAHADICRARIAELSDAESSLAQRETDLAAALAERDGAAQALHAAREQAAPKLAAAVTGSLAELAMEGARFDVVLQPREPGPSGTDTVEFLLAPNAGVPAGPVREAASGGELSRVMLALLGIAGDGSSATLVFDEIDAGIGGQTARAVGARLLALAQSRQVLCITHLPQVASLAQRHFSIEKDAAGEPALTTVTQLEAPEVVEELVRMLGADADDRAAHDHARELLRTG